MVHKGRALVHLARLPLVTKELALAFSSKDYESVFTNFIQELQAEIDAKNGFDEYLKEIAESGMENHVLYPPSYAIYDVIH